MTVKMSKPKPAVSREPGTFVRFSEQTLERLHTLRAREDRNLSSMIRILVEEALEARKKAHNV